MDFPLGVLKTRTPPLKVAKPSDLIGWTPIRLYRSGDELKVIWYHLGGLPFKDWNFGSTLNRHLGKKSFARLAETRLKMLAEVKRCGRTLEPSGFIFHMSRCGSTLAARYLAAIPGTRVLSEPSVFDELFFMSGLSEAEQIVKFRELVRVLGRPLAGEKRYFIKFTPPILFKLSLISKAFPGVPWIFLYRDPVEVMASNFNNFRAGWFWNLWAHGLKRQDVVGLSWAEVCARALARVCRAAVKGAKSGGLIINYKELDPKKMLKHYGITPTAADLRRLARVGRYYAKAPLIKPRKFRSDSRKIRRLAPPAIRRQSRIWLADLYRALEDLR